MWYWAGELNSLFFGFLICKIKYWVSEWKSLSRPNSLRPHWLTVHEILQARILEWVAFLLSRGSSQPRDWTEVSLIACGFFTSWATREVPKSDIKLIYKSNILVILIRAQKQTDIRDGKRKLSNKKVFFGQAVLYSGKNTDFFHWKIWIQFPKLRLTIWSWPQLQDEEINIYPA